MGPRRSLVYVRLNTAVIYLTVPAWSEAAGWGGDAAGAGVTTAGSAAWSGDAADAAWSGAADAGWHSQHGVQWVATQETHKHITHMHMNRHA